MYLRYLRPEIEKWFNDYSRMRYGQKKNALNKTMEEIAEFMQDPETQDLLKSWKRKKVQTRHTEKMFFTARSRQDGKLP